MFGEPTVRKGDPMTAITPSLTQTDPLLPEAPARKGRTTAAARNRALLLLGTVAAVAVAGSLDGAVAHDPDPDLVRLMRFMALLKGAFLVVALVGGFWRLARPAPMWRTAVYVGGPAMMAAGTVALWRLQDAGTAAAALHIGLFALIATALTDRDFIPASRGR